MDVGRASAATAKKAITRSIFMLLRFGEIVWVEPQNVVYWGRGIRYSWLRYIQRGWGSWILTRPTICDALKEETCEREHQLIPLLRDQKKGILEIDMSYRIRVYFHKAGRSFCLENEGLSELAELSCWPNKQRVLPL